MVFFITQRQRGIILMWSIRRNIDLHLQALNYGLKVYHHLQLWFCLFCIAIIVSFLIFLNEIIDKEMAVYIQLDLGCPQCEWGKLATFFVHVTALLHHRFKLRAFLETPTCKNR